MDHYEACSHDKLLQKNGEAGPSMAATLIGRLPHQDDSQRPIEEGLAKSVIATAYLGS